MQILASASYDDTINLYLDDPSDDWFCATTLTGHASTVWTLAWEPENGKYLASGSDDHTIRIWEITGGQMSEMSGELVDVLEGHGKSPIFSISWSRGRPAEGGLVREGFLGWLVSVGGDGSILVWEIKVRTCLYSMGVRRTHFWQEETQQSESSKPKLSHRIIARLDSSHGVFDVNNVAWCPRPGLEDIFASAGDDGHIKVWKVEKS